MISPSYKLNSLSIAILQMTFFQQQEAARKRTLILIGYFVLAVICIIAAIYTVIVVMLHNVKDDATGASLLPSLWNPEIFTITALVTLLIIVGGSIFKILALRGGGSVVARNLGGRLVLPGTRDPDERKLLNVVEEISIASGVSIPAVFVLEDEAGINAFAAGFSPNRAAVAVTRGCMKLLSRDELQGVIAHEFSHILNGDMRLNIRLMGIIHGILIIGLIGRAMVRSVTRSNRRSSSRSGKDSGGPVLVLGISLFIIGYIGVFFGKIIKAAVSRQREYLADASAVQFTRNPVGISGALKKIGGLSHGSLIENSSAEEASHLFFANGLGQAFLNLLATHPPLTERIQRIESGL